MNQRTLILLFLSLSSLFAKAQDSLTSGFRITISPGQYLLKDYNISVEKASGKKMFGLGFAYKPATKNAAEVEGGFGIGDFGYAQYMLLNPLYSAVTINASYRYFVIPKRGFFLEANGFYRYGWFDDKYLSHPSTEKIRYEITGFRSERQYVAGLKALVGKTYKIGKGKKVFPVLDIFGGVGIRHKTTDFLTINGTIGGDSYTNKRDYDDYWLPSIHAGVKFGLGFNE